MVARCARARRVRRVLMTFRHLLIRQGQPRSLVLRPTALVRHNPLQALLVVHDLVHGFLPGLPAEVHALHLLCRLLKGLPVLLGGPAVDGGSLLGFEGASIAGAVVDGSTIARVNDGHSDAITTGDDGHLRLLLPRGRHLQVISVVRVQLTLRSHLLVRRLLLRLLRQQVDLLHRDQLLHLLLVAHDVLQLLLHLQLLCQLRTLPLGGQVVLRIDTRLTRLIQIKQLFLVLGRALCAPRRVALVAHQLLLDELQIVQLVDDVAARVVVHLLLQQLYVAGALRFYLLVVVVVRAAHARVLAAADDHAHVHGVIVVASAHVEAG